MDETEWENILENKDMLLKLAGLSYLGLSLYLAMKEKKPLPRKISEPTRKVKPRPKPRSLSEMISRMIEEAYTER